MSYLEAGMRPKHLHWVIAAGRRIWALLNKGFIVESVVIECVKEHFVDTPLVPDIFL